MALNRIIITEWAFDSYLKLVGDHVIVSDPLDRNFNYRELREDALLLKNFRMKGESPKFQNPKFWQHFKSTHSDLFEMKWHNFGHAKVQFRLHIYVSGKDVFLLQGYVKDPKNQSREMIKSEAFANFIDQGRYYFRGELK